MRVGAFGCVLAGLMALTAEARAGGWSDLTLGVGTGIGFHSAGGPDEKATTAFMNQADVRFKFLTVLGVDYAVDLMRNDDLVTAKDDELHFQAKMRLTGLVYPYNGKKVGFYIGVGLGGAKLADLGRLDAPTNSYHGGIGFELHLTDHMSLDSSFMLVAPGRRSVENVAVARVEAALAKGDSEAMKKVEAPGLDDFISLGNHEFMVRFFLFL